MADDAFALSPISARATQPREEDYEAISEAFMETSRGRWFLGEYARRNRNADTRMVLDAVARIEENLAAQQQPAADSGLPEALAAIGSALDEARAVASMALDDLTSEAMLAPVRKGARVIREIAWRLREIGADGRICDLIDQQVSAIESGCGQLASADARPAVSAAFDLIEQRIGTLGDGDTVTAQAADESFSSAIPEEETAATADDDALLDMIAFEMAAVDPADAEGPLNAGIEETPVAESPLAAPDTIAQTMESPAAPPPTLQPAVQPSLQAPHQPSLGSTLIANGIVRRPRASASDPLAPIRRMSQAEKIAFFS